MTFLKIELLNQLIKLNTPQHHAKINLGNYKQSKRKKENEKASLRGRD